MTARTGPDRPVGSSRLLALRRTVQLAGRSFGRVAANYTAHQRKVVQTLTLLEPVLVCGGSRWQVHAKPLPASLPFLPRSLVGAPPVHDQLGGMIMVWAPPPHQIGDDATGSGPVGDPYPAKLGQTASTLSASQRI